MVPYLPDCTEGRDGTLAVRLLRVTRWCIRCGPASGDSMVHFLPESSERRAGTFGAGLKVGTQW